jgi:hypothetical protein
MSGSRGETGFLPGPPEMLEYLSRFFTPPTPAAAAAPSWCGALAPKRLEGLVPLRAGGMGLDMSGM